jgi:hypothetical protein
MFVLLKSFKLVNRVFVISPALINANVRPTNDELLSAKNG